jgi:hypothetical protein
MLPGVGLSTELQACLKEFTADGAREIGRKWQVSLRGTLLDVPGAAEKPLLHPWSENHNLTRGVLAISDHSDRNSRYLACSPSRIASATRCFAIHSWSFPQGAVTIHPVA